MLLPYSDKWSTYLPVLSALDDHWMIIYTYTGRQQALPVDTRHFSSALAAVFVAVDVLMRCYRLRVSLLLDTDARTQTGTHTYTYTQTCTNAEKLQVSQSLQLTISAKKPLEKPLNGTAIVISAAAAAATTASIKMTIVATTTTTISSPPTALLVHRRTAPTTHTS